VGFKEIYKNPGRFWVSVAACTGRRRTDGCNDLLPEWRKFMNPKEMTMKPRITAKTLTSLAVTALALTIAPLTALAKPCSVATLKGTYADRDTGFISGVGAFAGVNLETFDGNGAMTATGTASLNGTIVSGSSYGTYTVNPDCTGTYTVQNPLGLTVHAFFVIDDNGNEFQDVITDAGTVINCVARKQFPVDDDSEQ
jgi:hypothetical protein